MSSIYKVLTEEEWEHAISLGYVVTKLDNDDGFIHLSTSKQLALTLHLYFKNSKKVILLEIDQDSIKDEIVFEGLYGSVTYLTKEKFTVNLRTSVPP